MRTASGRSAVWPAWSRLGFGSNANRPTEIGCCNASQTTVNLTGNRLDSSSDLGDPCGIRTRDLHLERVASWAARRTGHSGGAAARLVRLQEYTGSLFRD